MLHGYERRAAAIRDIQLKQIKVIKVYFLSSCSRCDLYHNMVRSVSSLFLSGSLTRECVHFFERLFIMYAGADIQMCVKCAVFLMHGHMAVGWDCTAANNFI